jgi:hypothetical protein
MKPLVLCKVCSIHIYSLKWTMEKDTSQDTNKSQNSFVECKLEIESVWSMNCITLNSRNNSCHVFDDDTSQAAKLNTSTIEQCYGDSYPFP